MRLLAHDDRVEIPGSHPVVVKPDPVVQGLDREWPMLLGYNQLIAKVLRFLLWQRRPHVGGWFYGKGRLQPLLPTVPRGVHLSS